MISCLIKRLCTYSVLVSYLATHLIAPVYACQQDGVAATPLYRYQLKITTQGPVPEVPGERPGEGGAAGAGPGFKVELARKPLGSPGGDRDSKGRSAQTLFTAAIFPQPATAPHQALGLAPDPAQGIRPAIMSPSFAPLDIPDPVLEAFRKASADEWFQKPGQVQTWASLGFSWDIPGFANLVFATDGSVVVGQDSASPAPFASPVSFSATGALALKCFAGPDLKVKAPVVEVSGEVRASRFQAGPSLKAGRAASAILPQFTVQATGRLSAADIYLNQVEAVNRGIIEGMIPAGNRGPGLPCSLKLASSGTFANHNLLSSAGTLSLGVDHMDNSGCVLASGHLDVTIGTRLANLAGGSITAQSGRVRGKGIFSNAAAASEGKPAGKSKTEPGSIAFAKDLDFNHFTGTVENQGVLIVGGQIRGQVATLNNQALVEAQGGYDLTIKNLENGTGLQNPGEIRGGGKLRLGHAANYGTIDGKGLDVSLRHDFANDGSMDIANVRGDVTFTNHGQLVFQGTDTAPSLLDVQAFHNRKLKDASHKTEVKGTALKVTSRNQAFVNHPESEIKLDNLEVQAYAKPDTRVPGSSAVSRFTNKGVFQVKKADITRDRVENSKFFQAHQLTIKGGKFHNTESGRLKVLDSFDSTAHVVNDGEMDVKNLLKVMTANNKGIVKGDALKLDVEKQFESEGKVTVSALTGAGNFFNHHTLNFITAPQGTSPAAQVGITQLVNETDADKDFSARITGGEIRVAASTMRFANKTGSAIKAKRLVMVSSPSAPGSFLAAPASSVAWAAPLTVNGKPAWQSWFNNDGDIIADIMDISRQAIWNGGTIMASTFMAHAWSLVNETTGNLKVTDAFAVDAAQFDNEGNLATRGTFTQKSGQLINKNTWVHQGNPKGKTVLALGTTTVTNTGKMIWQDSTWQAEGTPFYRNQGTWGLKGMTAVTKVKIANEGTAILGLERSQASIGTFANGKDARILIRDGTSLKFADGQNKGLLEGGTLTIPAGQSMANEGQMVLKEVSGQGSFTNKGELKLQGTQSAPAQVSISHFENGAATLKPHRQPAAAAGAPIIRGTDIKLTPANKTFISHEGATILANCFTAAPAPKAPVPPSVPGRQRLVWPPANPPSTIPETRFETHGTLTVDDLDLSRDEIINSGLLDVLNLTLRGINFHNQAKGQVQVKGNTTLDLKGRFLNEGEFTSKGGTFTQTRGEIENTGMWDHEGNIDLGTASIENRGTLTWKGGTLKAASRWNTYWNHGTWLLDGMTSAGAGLQLGNFGTVHLKGSTLNFQKFLNHKTLVLCSGTYYMGTLKSDNLLSFQDNEWVFTDALTYKWLIRNDLPEWSIYNRLTVKDLDLGGEIESQKTLWYDFGPLPKVLRSQGDLTFSSFFSYCRTLDMLHRIQARGTVTLYVNNIQVSKNYEFGTIGHLNLQVHGSFTNPGYLFTAPILTLYIHEEFIGGTDNAHMGTVAATKGPLTVTAAGIDARFAKIYGKGQSRLEAMGAWRVSIDKKKEMLVKVCVANICKTGESKLDVIMGDIWVGEEARGTGVEPHLGNHTYAVQNGAYVASDSRLTLRALRDILIDYGQVISSRWLDLEAPRLIRNLAGLIAVQGPVFIKGKEYTHTRAPTLSYGRYYHGLFGLSPHIWTDIYPGSGPAILNASGNIYLWTAKVNNVSSTILSGGIIEMQHKALSSKTSGYIETAQGCSHNSSPWVLPCTVQSAQAIHINIGDVAISGTMNSPVIKIQATGSGLFANASRSRTDTVPAHTPLFNLTHYIFEQTKIPGLYIQEQQPNGLPLVRTAFSMGSPTKIPAGACLPLASKGSRTITTPLTDQAGKSDTIYLNPLTFLGWEPLLQQGLCQKLGKAFILDAHGNRRSGHDLLGTLFANTQHYSEKNNKNSITALDLENLPYAILLYELQQIGRHVQQNTLVALPACEVSRPNSITSDEMDVHTGGDLLVEDALITARNRVTLLSDQHLTLRTTFRRVNHWQNGWAVTEDIAGSPVEISCMEGSATLIGKKGYRQVGASVMAKETVTVGSTEGDPTIEALPLKRTATHTHTEDGGFFGSDETTIITHVTTTALPSHVVSTGAKVEILGGKDNSIKATGAIIMAPEKVTFKGKELHTEASIGVNSTTTHREEDGAFSSKTTHSHQENLSAQPTIIVAKEVDVDTQEATLNGTIVKAKVLNDHTRESMKIGPSVGEVFNRQQITSDSAFARSDCGVECRQEVMVQTRLDVDRIIRKLDKGKIILESVNWDRDRTQIIGTFEETAYELKKWERRWEEHDQVFPDAALIAVAFAITVVTQGAGSGLLAGMLPSTAAAGAATATATAAATTTAVAATTAATAATAAATTATAVLGTTGVVMADAAFTALCVQTATNFFKTGDPIAALGSNFTRQGLESLTISVLTAGLCDKLAPTLGVTTNPALRQALDPTKYQATLGEFAKSAALKTGVCAAVSTGVTGQAPAPVEIVKNVAINTAASYASHQIGQAYGKADKPLSYGEHKLLHGAVGGAAGWLINPTTQGLVAGAGGAIAAEMMAEEVIKPEEIARQVWEEAQNAGITLSEETFIYQVQDKLQSQIDQLRLGVGALACATGQDVSTALITSGIALENNTVIAATNVAQAMWAMLAAGFATAATILTQEKLDKDGKTAQTQNDTGSATAGANATPPEDWEPDDHEGDRWKKNDKGRWHNEYANDKNWTPNRPNFDNEKLQKVADQLYRSENKLPGESAEMLKKEVVSGSNPRHLIKCQDRISQLRKILSDPKEKISRLDRQTAERIMKELREAINFIPGGNH